MFDFAVFTFIMSTEYGDLGFVFAFVGGVGGVFVLGAISSFADLEGRWTNLLLDMMSFQLDVDPPANFIAGASAALAVSIANSQYCWLSISLVIHSDVSISSRNLLSGGRLQMPISSWRSISFMMSCFASSLIIPFM